MPRTASIRRRPRWSGCRWGASSGSAAAASFPRRGAPRTFSSRGGGFELVAIDLGDLPPWTLARTPPAVFVRLQRAAERAGIGLLVAGPRRVAGSLAAVAVALVPRRVHWVPGGPGLLAGLATEARLIRSRTRAPGAGVPLVWTALEADGPAQPASPSRARVAAHGGRG